MRIERPGRSGAARSRGRQESESNAAMPSTSTPDRSARPCLLAACVAELPCHIAEQRSARDRTSRIADCLLDHLGVGEVQEQRHQIGQRFVKRRHVHVRGVQERRSQPVEERVRDLVGDDVVAERGADQAVAHDETGRIAGRVEVAERDVTGVAVVTGVAPAEPERPEDEPQRAVLARGHGPADVASQRAPESRVGQRADRIDHLQVEPAVRRRRRQSFGNQQVRVVEIQRG